MSDTAKSANPVGLWVGIGLAIGAGAGVALNSIPIGVGLGLIAGLVIGTARKRRRAQQDR